jgi:signal transduction histidine kinase
MDERTTKWRIEEWQQDGESRGIVGEITFASHTSISDFSQLSANVAEISRKISSISHELHSTELDVLGLVKAVKLVCYKWAKRQAITFDFACDQIPDDIDRTQAISFRTYGTGDGNRTHV